MGLAVFINFSFPDTVCGWNSLVIWLVIFNFKLILKVLKCKHIEGVRMMMCHILHPSPLPTIGDSQINVVTLIPVIGAIFHLIESCLQTKHNKDADACCSHRSGSWKMPCDSVHAQKEGKADDSSSCPAMVLFLFPGPQNLVHLKQLSKHLIVKIFCMLSPSSLIQIFFLILLWGKMEHVLCVV